MKKHNSIIGIVSIILNYILFVNMKKKYKIEDEYAKMTKFYYLLIDWVRIKQDGKKVETYFKSHNYKTVAIYGMRELGELLYDELSESEVEVKYLVDQNKEMLYSEKNIYSPDDKLEEVDVMIVTAIYHYEKIYNDIRKKIDFPIISLEDVIDEIKCN